MCLNSNVLVMSCLDYSTNKMCDNPGRQLDLYDSKSEFSQIQLEKIQSASFSASWDMTGPISIL